MDMHRSRGVLARPLWAGGIVIASAAIAHAEPAPPFSVLLQQAESTSPRLAETHANIRAAEGAAIQASARPNPSLALEAENLGVGTADNGLILEQTTLSVSQPLEIGGQRGARIAAANATIESAHAQLLQRRSDVIYDLAVAYVSAELAVARVELERDTLDRAQEDERAARALVNAGREADLRAVQANAATAAAQAGLESAEAESNVALVRLSQAAGRPEPFTGIDQALLDKAADLPAPSLEPTVIFPAERSAEAARDEAARRVSVERTRAIPDLTFSLGIRQYQGENAKGLIAGIGIPLPLFNDNRGGIAAAEAELAAAEARLDAARLNAEADWRAASLQALAAIRQLNATTQAETAASEAYRLARLGYDAGRTPLIEVLIARQNLTEAQTRALDARAARLNADATLSHLAGSVPFGGNP